VGTPGEERSHRSGARLFAVRTGKQVGPGERSELSATLHISRGIVQRQEVHFAGAATSSRSRCYRTTFIAKRPFLNARYD
jgi:hypothetical protein